jgi:hypothetical protein
MFQPLRNPPQGRADRLLSDEACRRRRRRHGGGRPVAAPIVEPRAPPGSAHSPSASASGTRIVITTPGFLRTSHEGERCLTEGRRALMVRVAASRGEWSAGASCRCRRPWPTGARAEELALLRPHMKTRLSCRARSNEFGAAPAPVAALVPPVAVVAASSGDSAGLLERCWGRPAEGGVGSRRRTAEGRRLGGARSRRRGAGHGPEGGGGGAVSGGAHGRRNRGRPAGRPPAARPAAQEIRPRRRARYAPRRHPWPRPSPPGQASARAAVGGAVAVAAAVQAAQSSP